MGERQRRDAAIGAALQGRPAEGILELERSIDLSPKEPALGFWIYALACGYLASRQLDVAETQLRRALKYDPKLTPAQLQLGVLRLQQGRAEDAQQHFSRAKELDAELTPQKAAAITGAPEALFSL